jgi:hypothetical protein
MPKRARTPLADSLLLAQMTPEETEAFNMFGPVTKEGRMPRTPMVRAPGSGTSDQGFVPSPDVLQPPAKVGQNVFGLSLEQMIKRGIDPSNPNPNRQNFNKLRIRDPDLLEFFSDKFEKEAQNLSTKQVVQALLALGDTPQKIETMRQRAVAFSENTAEDKNPDAWILRQLRGRLGITKAMSVLQLFPEGASP